MTRLKELYYSEHPEKGIDPIRVMLDLNSKYTLLPDLFEIFGRESFLKFIKVFGGKSIVKIPSYRDLEKSFEAVAIWQALRKSNTPEMVKRLCNRYSMKESEVRAAYQRIEGLLNEEAYKFLADEEATTESGTGSDAGEISTAELDDIEAAEDDSEGSEGFSFDELFGVETGAVATAVV